MCSSDLPLPRLTTMAVSMPVAVPQLWVQMADAPSAAGARRVDIQPTLLVPEGQRVHADVRRVESVPGRPDAYLAYVNDYAFAEGGVFWTRGTGEASVMVATGGAPFVALTLPREFPNPLLASLIQQARRTLTEPVAGPARPRRSNR